MNCRSEEKDTSDRGSRENSANRSNYNRDCISSICPSKLSKHELEQLYFALIENNLELKKRVNVQDDQLRQLSTKLQRMTATQKTYAGHGAGKDMNKVCCEGYKAIINEQKHVISEIQAANEKLTERIKQLNMQLESTKSFLKKSPPSANQQKKAPGSRAARPMSAASNKPVKPQTALNKPMKPQTGAQNKAAKPQTTQKPVSEVRSVDSKPTVEPTPRSPSTPKGPVSPRPQPKVPKPVTPPKDIKPGSTMQANQQWKKSHENLAKLNEQSKTSYDVFPNKGPVTKHASTSMLDSKGSRPDTVECGCGNTRSVSCQCFDTKVTPEKTCNENICSSVMAELKQKIVFLQEELSKTHDEYSSRITRLEREISEVRAANMRAANERAARERADEQMEELNRERDKLLRAEQRNCGDLALQLSIERSKVAELETQLKAASITSQVAETLGEHLKDVTTNVNTKADAGNFTDVTNTETVECGCGEDVCCGCYKGGKEPASQPASETKSLSKTESAMRKTGESEGQIPFRTYNKQESDSQSPFLTPENQESDDQAPYLSPKKPNQGGQSPFLSFKDQDSDDQAPYLSPKKPNQGGQSPFLSFKDQDSDDQAPYLSPKKPNQGGQSPFLSFKDQDSHDQAPCMSIKKPESDDQAPSISPKKPELNGDAPYTSPKKPESDDQAPYTSSKKLESDSQAPHMSPKKPESNDQAPMTPQCYKPKSEACCSPASEVSQIKAPNNADDSETFIVEEAAPESTSDSINKNKMADQDSGFTDKTLDSDDEKAKARLKQELKLRINELQTQLASLKESASNRSQTTPSDSSPLREPSHSDETETYNVDLTDSEYPARVNSHDYRKIRRIERHESKESSGRDRSKSLNEANRRWISYDLDRPHKDSVDDGAFKIDLTSSDEKEDKEKSRQPTKTSYESQKYQIPGPAPIGCNTRGERCNKNPPSHIPRRISTSSKDGRSMTSEKSEERHFPRKRDSITLTKERSLSKSLNANDSASPSFEHRESCQMGIDIGKNIDDREAFTKLDRSKNMEEIKDALQKLRFMQQNLDNVSYEEVYYDKPGRASVSSALGTKTIELQENSLSALDTKTDYKNPNYLREEEATTSKAMKEFSPRNSFYNYPAQTPTSSTPKTVGNQTGELALKRDVAVSSDDEPLLGQLELCERFAHVCHCPRATRRDVAVFRSCSGTLCFRTTDVGAGVHFRRCKCGVQHQDAPLGTQSSPPNLQDTLSQGDDVSQISQKSQHSTHSNHSVGRSSKKPREHSMGRRSSPTIHRSRGNSPEIRRNSIIGPELDMNRIEVERNLPELNRRTSQDDQASTPMKLEQYQLKRRNSAQRLQEKQTRHTSPLRRESKDAPVQFCLVSQRPNFLKSNTYVIRGSAEVVKCSRATSPVDNFDNTDREISSMTDLPSERDVRWSPRSPGEDKATTMTSYTDSSTSPTALPVPAEYSTYSEGELPQERATRLMDFSQQLPKDSSSEGEQCNLRVTSSQKMEQTLQAIGEELALCRRLLLQTQRPADQPKPLTRDASSDPRSSPHIALHRAAPLTAIGDAFTPRCLFVLHIGTIVLSDEAVMSSRDLSLVMTWQFYDQSVAMTRMRAGRVMHFDFSTEYDVKLTDDFLDYLKYEEMTIKICELNKHNEPFATCSLPLRDALLHTNRRADISLALISGPGMQRACVVADPLDSGDEVGVLDLWCMLRAEPRLLPTINKAIANVNSEVRGGARPSTAGVIMAQINEDEQEDNASTDIDLISLPASRAPLEYPGTNRYPRKQSGASQGKAGAKFYRDSHVISGPGMQRACVVADPLDSGDEVGVLDLWCMLRAEPRLLPTINKAIANVNSEVRGGARPSTAGVIMAQINEDEQEDNASTDIDLISLPASRAPLEYPGTNRYPRKQSGASQGKAGAKFYRDSHVKSLTVYNPTGLEEDLESLSQGGPGRAVDPVNPSTSSRVNLSALNIHKQPAGHHQKWATGSDRRISSGFLVNEVPTNIRSTSEMKRALEKGIKETYVTSKAQKIDAKGAGRSNRDKQRMSLTPLRTNNLGSMYEVLDDGWKGMNQADNQPTQRNHSMNPYRRTSQQPNVDIADDGSDNTLLSRKYDNMGKLLSSRKDQKPLPEALKRVKIENDKLLSNQPPPLTRAPESTEYIDRLRTKTVDITILWLALNEECEAMSNPNVQRLYVSYTFLGRSGAELETPNSLPKPKRSTDKCYFNFKKSFHLTEAEVPLLGRLARSRAPKGRPVRRDCVIFTVISEPLEDPLGINNCEDVGYAYLYFGDLLAYGSGSDSYVEVLTVHAQNMIDVCGVLAVKVDGLDVVRKCQMMAQTDTWRPSF